MKYIVTPLIRSALRRLNTNSSKTDSIRNWFFLSFGFAILYLIYGVTRWSLLKVNETPQLSQIPPFQFFALVFTFLQVMIIVSGIFSALGVLFSSEDLDLLRKAPLTWRRFFGSRFSLTLFMPAWMPLLFLIPFFIAFQIVYQGPWYFSFLAPLILIPYFAIPAGIACIAAQLMALFLPWKKARGITFFIFILFILGAIKLFSELNLGMSSSENAKELLKVLALLSVSDIRWLPSTWVAEILESSLLRHWTPRTLDLCLLLTNTAVAAYFLSSACLRFFYDRSYGVSRGNTNQGTQLLPRMSTVIKYLPLTTPQRVFIQKEWILITRDIGQLLQLVLLLGITSLYLSHLRAFTVVTALPDSMQYWWVNFLFIANISMAAFLATALCVRFVYPSISLEGKAIWLIETSPLQIHRILQYKRMFYVLPLTLLMICFFVMGARALDVSLEITLLCAFCAFSLCYALVSLALGLGAYFARFDWEHQAELAGSFGGLLFMFMSIAMIFVSMTPLWILLLPSAGPAPVKLPLLLASLVLVFAGHVWIARKAFKMGALKLQSRND